MNFTFFFLRAITTGFNEMPSGFLLVSHLWVHLQAVKVPHSYSHQVCFDVGLSNRRISGENGCAFGFYC